MPSGVALFGVNRVKSMRILTEVYRDAVQTDEACRRSVHQWLQQTPRTAISAEVPGVSDRKAGQVGDLHVRMNRRVDGKGE